MGIPCIGLLGLSVCGVPPKPAAKPKGVKMAPVGPAAPKPKAPRVPRVPKLKAILKENAKMRGTILDQKAVIKQQTNTLIWMHKNLCALERRFLVKMATVPTPKPKMALAPVPKGPPVVACPIARPPQQAAAPLPVPVQRALSGRVIQPVVPAVVPLPYVPPAQR